MRQNKFLFLLRRLNIHNHSHLVLSVCIGCNAVDPHLKKGGVAEFENKVKAMGHGWKAEAKRARKRSLEIEKLMKEFRKTSVGEAAAKE